MHRKPLQFSLFLLVVALLSLSAPAFAQDDLPAAEIENDEGGVAVVTGQLDYSDPNLPTFGSEPIVFLGDMSELFGGDFVFTTEYLDLESPQVLGDITTDIFESPFTYELRLPIDPGGKLHDVDNDDADDAGVGVYSINFTFNGLGDEYIDAREFIYFRSYEMSLDYETLYDIISGKVLIYAPDDEQGFPASPGDDGELFTEDDPIVSIPAGWTVVSLESDPFTFDRSRTAEVDIIESEGEALPDFSQMGFVEAFDAMIEMMANEYAFTEFKGLDWDALSDEFRPLIEAAEEDEDPIAFQLAMQQFVEAVPDGHMGINAPYLDAQPVPSPDIAGGLGIAVRELSDGRVIVNFLGEGSPAAEEGIELGAEIIDLNGEPILDAVAALPGLNPPYSGEALKRLEQLRQVTRFEIGEEVELTYQNPGDTAPTTVTLTAIEEDESRLFSRQSVFGPLLSPTLPLEYEILDNGYGYIRIFSFNDNYDLSLSLWERAMQTMSGFGVPGIIIDMRYNGGGSPSISEPMIGYFIDEPLDTGTAAQYFPDLDAFQQDDLFDRIIQPAEEANRYYGEIAVLISPACQSNCEFFANAISLLENGTVIGHYPTSGLGGGVSYFFMPEDIFIQYPTQRPLNREGDIIIENTGVEPDIVVPVTEETVLTEDDVLLDAAIAYLDEATSAQVNDIGDVAVGDEVDGELAVGTRDRYTLTVEENGTFDIVVSEETGEFDTVLRIYNDTDTLIAENDDAEPGVVLNSTVAGLEVAAGDTIIIEVATYDDTGEGAYTLTVTEAE